MSLLRLNGLHSSGGASGKPLEPEDEDEDEDDEDEEGGFANGDSTQIPARQQPIESQFVCPGMPVESPQMRPSSQQLVGGICPAGLVQRHASPAVGSRCDVLDVVDGSTPSPSTVCEQATREAMPSEAARAKRRDFMPTFAGVTHAGDGARPLSDSRRSCPSDSRRRRRARCPRVIATPMFRT